MAPLARLDTPLTFITDPDLLRQYYDYGDPLTPTLGALLQTAVIDQLPRTGGSIEEALQIMGAANTRVNFNEIGPIQGVVLVNGHHGDSEVPTIADSNLTQLCAAATAIGYAVWGDEHRRANPLVVHEELVASRHSDFSHQLAFLTSANHRPYLGGVVTLVQAHELDPRNAIDKQPWISIGFNELLFLPENVAEELKSVDPSHVGELTLFTILENFRDVQLKRRIAGELLKQAIIRAKELGISHLYAIMPRFVSQLLPKDAYQVEASTSGLIRASAGSTPIEIPKIRKLEPKDGPGYESANAVYTPYQGYWKDSTELQLCRFNLDWEGATNE